MSNKSKLQGQVKQI